MFSHVMVGVKDLEASRKFYDAVLGTLGIKPGNPDKKRYFWRSPTGVFGITIPINGEPASAANGAPSVSQPPPPSWPMPGTQPGWPTVVWLAKTLRAGAVKGRAACTWPTCATPTATSSARYTVRPRGSGKAMACSGLTHALAIARRR